MTVDYYRLLSIPQNASPKEIKIAYRRMAEVYHPDKMSELPPAVRKEGEEIMRLLNEAKSALLDHPRQDRFDDGFSSDNGRTADAIIIDEEGFDDFIIEEEERDLDGKMKRVLRSMKEVFIRDRKFQRKIAMAEEIVDAQVIEDPSEERDEPTEMTLEFAVVSKKKKAPKKKKGEGRKFRIIAVEYEPKGNGDGKER
ncbi:MAG: DnaJ domain-containing protein [Candidatus Thermoplasmatota archaeon]|nr:DnaJ domain-containing protein [Candidatus Thermoplasmatota archaeon]